MEQFIRNQEKFGPGKERRVYSLGQAVIHGLPAGGEKFVETHTRGKESDRFFRRDDGKGHHSRPCPGGEVMDVERKPLGQVDDFRGQIGGVRPRPLAEKGEPVFGEDSDSLGPIVGEEPPAGLGDYLLVGGKPRITEGGVAFNRGVDVALFGVAIHIPAPVGPLLVDDVIHHAFLLRVVEAAKHHCQDPLGLHAAIRFHRGVPVTSRKLRPQKPGNGPRQRRPFRRGVVFSQ